MVGIPTRISDNQAVMGVLSRARMVGYYGMLLWFLLRWVRAIKISVGSATVWLFACTNPCLANNAH